MPRPADPDVKARVIAAVKSGMGTREAAKEFKVSPGAVSHWKAEDEAATALLTTEKRQARIDLAAKATEYIGEAFDTLNAHLRLARDPKWFRKQSAADIATFDGVHHDKLVRTLAAAQRATASDELGRDGDAIEGEFTDAG